MTRRSELEKSLGIKFRDQDLLRQALVHRSYLNENPEFAPEDNQRLEYLGDALLDFIVGEYLYRRFPNFREGKLTSLRAALVKTESLAELARRVDLGSYIYLGRGEEESGGRAKPSLLAAAVEALLGAVYLDQGLEQAKSFLLGLLTPRLEEIIAKGGKDYKSLLQERAQSAWGQIPVYRTISETGPDHAKEFTVEVLLGKKVLGRGYGLSKQSAEQDAAHQALQALEQG
ncbi:MAG: ribonuclease III [Chloroflexi bacterium]|nr:ribonuclease III [Chloroflexota bacterium]